MMRAADILAVFREAPFCSVEAITAGAPVLVLAPHPDDESLASGGLIASAVARGDEVHLAVLTDGTGSHPDSHAYPPPRLKHLRESETRAAMAELGVDADRVTFLAAPDAHAPTGGPAFDALAERLEKLVADRHVRLVLTTWRHDPHCDHEAAALLGEAVARAAGVRFLMTPVWGWTLADDHRLPGPVPAAWRLDITAQLPSKRRAIAAHVSQTTDLIDDSPAGFRLLPDFLTYFDRPWEVYIAA
jgi:LmbE family N-acetylglucosaminyl deacetylase